MYYRLYSVGCCWSSLTRVRFNMCRHDMQQPGMGPRDGRLPRPGLAVNNEKAPRPALSISAPLMEPDGCLGAYVRLPLWQPLQMWDGWHPFLSSLFILYPRYGRTPPAKRRCSSAHFELSLLWPPRARGDAPSCVVTAFHSASENREQCGLSMPLRRT